MERRRLIVFLGKPKSNLFGFDRRYDCRRRARDTFLERSVKEAVAHRGGSMVV